MRPHSYSAPVMAPGQKIAVIGSGAAGLAAAWSLSQRHQVSLIEAADRLGGHCHTHRVDTAVGPLDVDTGFIVFNPKNYPNLCKAFAYLNVPHESSDMSFAVSVDQGRLEYSGDGRRGMFAQKRNWLRPGHWRMVKDIFRFYREAPEKLAAGRLEQTPLAEFLDAEGYSRAFRYEHLMPLAAAIWSTPVAEIENFPTASFISFFHNHGLLQIKARPQWRTVSGGSQAYVTRLLADFAANGGVSRTSAPVMAVTRRPDGVALRCAGAVPERFDQVVIAAHADHALMMLRDAGPQERAVLGAFDYEENRVFLHTDTAQMPRRPAIWSCWNYLSESIADTQRLSVTYWMNQLQNLDRRAPLFVTLNPIRPVAQQAILAEMVYDHPCFDGKALRAQKQLARLQGRGGVWFAGSYFGFGFHEDAFTSGLNVGRALGCAPAWEIADWPPRAEASVLQVAAA